MGARWGPRRATVGPHLRDALRHLLFVFLVLLQAQAGRGGATLNGEGMALLELRERVEADPHGALRDWDPADATPCRWSGVHCFDGKVEILNLTGRELVGTLAPEIGRLQLLKSLILRNNNFRGKIPKEFGGLTALEVLDLSSNNLDGTIPEELMAMPLLKQLSLHDNQFQDDISSLHIQDISDEQAGCLSRKLGCWAGFKDWTSFSDLREKYSTNLASNRTFKSLGEPHIMQNLQSFASAVGRRLLGEVGNLPALSGNDAKSSGPVNSEEIQRAIDVLSLGSGSFSAFPNSEAEVLESAVNTDAAAMQSVAANQSTDEVSGSKHSKWAYFMIIPAAILLISLIVAPILVWRKRGRAAIGPWKTGLSGPLQKAFVTGVPKLNRPELEAACEDFSNIINTFPSCTVFKGTLSSGVEISVVSTAILSLKEWPKSSETCFRKKIDTLSRVNHKNFINLLGYCLENQPFMRMMVFEYAPNGTLSEHLHLKEFEHLDWAARMRIIMGVAYCLQYMHHDLNPPVAITDMRSDTIFMTDDYAAKIADVGIWKEVAIKAKTAKEDSSSRSECPPDIASNVYCFGTLLIEIISGKLPEADDQESMCNWAAEYLKGKSYSKLVDASLKEHNANELEAVCEVIQECIDPDSDQRPTMRDATRKLRQALNISPEAATPRLSPLWWAELEILSAEAT
ncbi:protein MALE DISCOVERER 2-like isoform X1 [Oryza glaberrima]|uniref:protein MALE DISCOVERER 2-like isoform X1 n=1 Tax=Oryza glaberrima TaxID=4538 RepID=UPI00224C2CD8|nr:protein MALE DISCOVERER 2-like isoform X1 [Oryza glaberrima]